MKNLTNTLTAEDFEKALRFAAKKHKGQRRKGDGKPYIMHPISVMTRILSIKKSTNAYLLGTAALLHDTVEDCGVSLRKIAKKFGFHVAALVKELTLDKSQYTEIGKTEYLCREMLRMSSYALAIKLCDRLDNVSDLDTMDEDFRKRYLEETTQIMERIIQRKLTRTHLTLVGLIEQEINKY
jgi:guanosine-3',5'-bis(diphosphate) 3'-pyrophosphohydrolase